MDCKTIGDSRNVSTQKQPVCKRSVEILQDASYGLDHFVMVVAADSGSAIGDMWLWDTKSKADSGLCCVCGRSAITQYRQPSSTLSINVVTGAEHTSSLTGNIGESYELDCW
jgi:hypothetical protein